MARRVGRSTVRRRLPEEEMTQSQIYLIGFVVVIIGLAIAAYLLAVPPVWIAVGIIVLVGIAIMAAANRSDTPPDRY
jgi:heme A synthase